MIWGILSPPIARRASANCHGTDLLIFNLVEAIDFEKLAADGVDGIYLRNKDCGQQDYLFLGVCRAETMGAF